MSIKELKLLEAVRDLLITYEDSTAWGAPAGIARDATDALLEGHEDLDDLDASNLLREALSNLMQHHQEVFGSEGICHGTLIEAITIVGDLWVNSQSRTACRKEYSVLREMRDGND